MAHRSLGPSAGLTVAWSVACWATVEAWAADGADSPAAINKFAKALGGAHVCAVALPNQPAQPSPCKAVRDKPDSQGIVRYRVLLQGPTILPSALLTPHMAGAAVSGEVLCNGKPVAYLGDLRRRGKRWWTGTLTAVSPASGCGEVALTIGGP